MKKNKSKSKIFEIIFFPLLSVAFIQIILLYGVFYFNGIFSSFDDNAKELLNESTRNKYQLLQTEMISNWTSLETLEDTINAIIQTELDEQCKQWDDIHTDASLNGAIVEAVASELVDKLRINKTTGIFFVLDGVAIENDADSYAGIYIRNRDPGTDARDNSDLSILRGLPPVSRKMGISLESFWTAAFRFEGGSENPDNAYFYNPLNAVKNNVVDDSQNCCYWSPTIKIGGKSDIAVVTYSVPLINEYGDVYGVLGVELSTKYLLSQVYHSETDSLSNHFYYVGITKDDGKTYEQIGCTSSKYQLSSIAADSISKGTSQWTIKVGTNRGKDLVLQGAVFPLKLYDNNTPYENEQWVLIGFEEEKSLFKAGAAFKRLMLIGVLTIMVLDIIVAFISTYTIVYPIRSFAKKLKNSNGFEKLNISYTGVNELDTLADAIMIMNRGMRESAKRTSKLIELSGLPVGVYEMRKKANGCYCSDGFFRLLDCENIKAEGNLVSREALDVILDKIQLHPVEEDVFEVKIRDKIRFIRVTSQEDENCVIGTVMDVTKEMEDRKRIEQERDFDSLTGIWNRRAFESHMEELFGKNKEALGVAAMLMFDLDNLKSVNDTYGHECGDLYIRTFAQFIRPFMSEHMIAARRSGDEFYAFLYGYESQEEVLERINTIWDKCLKLKMLLPDYTEFRIRVSAGFAWYPQDSMDSQMLIHYADFAMYYAKHTLKGSIKQFDMLEYNQDSFLFNGHNALNRLIDNEMVNFMFQPIVSARTGQLYGYEMLMRSLVEELHSPEAILRMAKSQGKLSHIEKITWFNGLACVRKGIQEGYIEKNAKIFINSIADQGLIEKDKEELKKLILDNSFQIVLEVLEGENNRPEYMQQKLEFVQEIGGQIAIDDYGTGYNSELALVMIPAQIVKIDMTFVRDVDKDCDKQIIIKNLISFARNRGIAVLAEGVETREEMEVLIGYGVDYMQGFYISKPQYVPTKNIEVQKEIAMLAETVRNT